MRATLLALSLVASFGSAANSSVVVAPLTIVNNIPFVSVKLNGSRLLTFAVDSGSARMVVDSKIAIELKLPQGGTMTISGAGAGRIPVTTVGKIGVDVGDLRAGNYDFIATDLAQAATFAGHPVDGILGYEILSRYVIEIDYPHREMRFHDAAVTAENVGEEVPVRIEKGWAFVRATVRVNETDEASDEFLIDSGSADGVDHPIATRASNRAPTTTGNGLGTAVEGFAAYATSLRLGSSELRNVPMASGGGTAATSKLIGGAVLSHFAVTLDYPHGRIFLARSD